MKKPSKTVLKIAEALANGPHALSDEGLVNYYKLSRLNWLRSIATGLVKVNNASNYYNATKLALDMRGLEIA